MLTDIEKKNFVKKNNVKILFFEHHFFPKFVLYVDVLAISNRFM